MKLMTKELERKFKNFPIYSQDGLKGEAKVVVEYFSPIGRATWLITEGEKMDDGDWELFGYCVLNDDQFGEFGYVLLSQLEEIVLPFGLKIERNLYLDKDITLLEAMKQCGITPPSYF